MLIFDSDSTQSRNDRAKNRSAAKQLLEHHEQDEQYECHLQLNMSAEPFLDHTEIEIQSSVDQSDERKYEQGTDDEAENNVDTGVQCRLITEKDSQFSFHYLRDNNLVNYYTSFDDFDHFLLFFNALGPATGHLKKFISLPDPKDQLLLTLMKLRQAKDDLELSFFFHISRSTVSDIVNCWINFLYFQLKELNIWPSQEIIKTHMPSNFGKQFPNTRVILDATEVPIHKPTDITSQTATFSTYKNRNTLKTVVGCSPRGLVTYISDVYGGATSDRQIIERSVLLSENCFDRNDDIMADRGIMVQDLFAAKDVRVNTPHTLKGKHQLEAKTVIKDRRIASKRIHIERVIGLSKTFKILQVPLHSKKLHLGGRIVFICFSISNFRQSIVNCMA